MSNHRNTAAATLDEPQRILLQCLQGAMELVTLIVDKRMQQREHAPVSSRNNNNENTAGLPEQLSPVVPTVSNATPQQQQLPETAPEWTCVGLAWREPRQPCPRNTPKHFVLNPRKIKVDRKNRHICKGCLRQRGIDQRAAKKAAATAAKATRVKHSGAIDTMP